MTDLSHYRAPRIPYAMISAVLLAAVYLSGWRAADDYAAGQATNASFGDESLDRSGSVPAAPLCPRLRGRSWLQASIVHRAENGREYHGCLYGRQWSAL